MTDSTDETLRRYTLAAISLTCWFGVILELCLSIRLEVVHGNPPVDGLIDFFGYFTVLTNLFVALSSSRMLMGGSTRLDLWFRTGMVRGCATTAMLLVGLAYHFLLLDTLSPTGWQWIADVTLHYVTPSILLVSWALFPPTEALPSWAPLAWSAYPFTYFLYVLLRGRLLATYPYHFFDVTHLGYAKALINAGVLLITFIVLGGIVASLAGFRRGQLRRRNA